MPTLFEADNEAISSLLIETFANFARIPVGLLPDRPQEVAVEEQEPVELGWVVDDVGMSRDRTHRDDGTKREIVDARVKDVSIQYNEVGGGIVGEEGSALMGVNGGKDWSIRPRPARYVSLLMSNSSVFPIQLLLICSP